MKINIITLDTETTGIGEHAKIIALAMVPVVLRGGPDTPMQATPEFDLPDKRVHEILNPGIPIEADATVVHGITDADVADKPSFAEAWPRIWPWLKACHVIAGHNVAFDVEKLVYEIRAMGEGEIAEAVAAKPRVCTMRTFEAMYPKNLGAVYEFYMGRRLDDSEQHDALYDADRTAELVVAQICAHRDKIPYYRPQDIAEVLWPRDPSWVDETGKFRRDSEGVIHVNFGKHKGAPADKVDKGFYKWMLNQDFPADAKDIARQFI